MDGGAERERRSRLLGVKLKALVGDHLGVAVASDPQPFPDGAALDHERESWILVDGDASRALGRALAWALRHDATALHIVAEQGSGVLARRAAGFDLEINIWFPVDRALVPALADALPPAAATSPAHRALVPLIEAGGADPVIEHGVVAGEVRGLEVCRVVDRATTGTFAELGDVVTPTDPGPLRDVDGVRLEVGVGAADREAFQLLHGDLPTVDALTQVVESVSSHRRADAIQHPLNRLGRERYLRWLAVDDPAVIGMSAVVAAEPPLPRQNLKDAVPCVAEGTTLDGRPTTIVFSSGVDLDLVPFVADVQAAGASDVTVVLRPRDHVPLTVEMAAKLRTPVEFLTLEA